MKINYHRRAIRRPSKTDNFLKKLIAYIARVGFNDCGTANVAYRHSPVSAGGCQSANSQWRSNKTRPGWIAPLSSLIILLSLSASVPPAFAQLIETVAGGGVGDGGLATSALLGYSSGMAIDSSGNLYVADTSNSRVRKVTAATGVITTVAGNGIHGYNGDNIAAVSAMITPSGVAVDSSGNLYIADSYNHRIRKVSATTGLITTIAGTGTGGFNGDNIPAISAALDNPVAIAFDANGNVYIVDLGNQRVRKVNVATGLITTVAGTGVAGYNGDNISAINATLNLTVSNRFGGIAFDSAGNLYIADARNHRIRKVAVASGIITTVAGNGSFVNNGDNIAATSAALDNPVGIALDSSRNLYIADEDSQRVRKVAAATGIITTIAGTGSFGYNGDNVSATGAKLYQPAGVAVDSSGDVYIVDFINQRIRKVTQSTGIINTVVGIGGRYNGDNIAAYSGSLNFPFGVAVDGSGDLFIADTYNNRIRKVTKATGAITTVAGTGTPGYNGDNIIATSAMLSFPRGIAFDSSGNLYIADDNNHRVRKVVAGSGIITTVAGNGTPGYNGDNIAAIGAALNRPFGVAVDSVGDLYIADYDNRRVRKVTAGTGTIVTVAGTGTFGYNGDNIAAATAMLSAPHGVAVDSSRNLYIADTFNHRIRRVAVASGVITTVAGTAAGGYNGDNIAATSAQLARPGGVAVDPNGNLYFADSCNNRVRKVTTATGIITTLAGSAMSSSGTCGDGSYNGDNIAATSATLAYPTSVALDAAGSLYIADYSNSRIRRVASVQSASASENYQGLWWNAPASSESGWGINFAHQGNTIFATWFTYDAAGKALWLTMTAGRIGTDYIGTLYQTRGPPFNTVPFSPTAVIPTAVGSGTLTFSDANNGRFSYILAGTTQSKAITRQVFGPLPTCIFGAQSNLALATNYQDLWWATGGAESGWGVNFTHQGDTIFATWFTYDVDGSPLWLSATATKTGGGVYKGTLYRTTGPAFNAVPFLPANIGLTAVGSLTLTFANGNAATFAYTLNGITQSKSITRQVFNAPGTVCQ